MDFISQLRAADWAIMFATLFGPVLAVQAQKRIELLRERRNQKHAIFTVLMGTRMARASPDHARALNMINLAFYGGKIFGVKLPSRSEEAVTRKWKEYLDNLSTPVTDANRSAVYGRREELFVDLLEAMSKHLGYDFDRVELMRGAYASEAQGIAEEELHRLRRSMLDVFEGQRPMRMAITDQG